MEFGPLGAGLAALGVIGPGIGVGIIGAFAAREVFVATMGVVYSAGEDVDEENVTLRERMRAEVRRDGRRVYTPLTGAHFLKVLMTPIPPPALFPLIESGWPADLLLQLGTQTVNGVSNKKGGARGRAADPAFSQLLAALQRIQASGAVSLRTEMSKETKQEGVLLTLGRKDISPETLADQALVRKLLGLRPGLHEFKIVYGTLAEADDVIAIQTRSAFQIMVELGADIQVPANHAAERRTYATSSEPAAGPDALLPLVRIQSGTSAPNDAFAAVKYRDYWYWIDDRDLRSKGVFTFLMVIMTLAEKEEKAPPPVVTIPAN